MFALNVGGTVAIAKACEKFAITRLVYVSSISAIGKPKNSGEYATEEFFNDPNDTNSNAYTQSKALAEIELHKAITTLDYVVGCPSVLLGAGDKKIASIISLIKKFPLIPLTAPIWSVVDVRDCAKALIFLLKSGKAKERYIITQHHVPLTTLAKQFSAALNKKSLVLTIPKRLLTILRPFAKVLQKVFPRTPFNEAAINSATSDKLFSNKKLLALGFRFTYTLDETILSIVEAS
jgi:nucleoside-diphosphate-sugar epimerase